jgi:DNA-binding YbaB/EbfC family protein
MFKELGQIAGLLKQLPKIREELDKLQQKLGEITAEGNAGGGMVRARANGRMEITAIEFSDDAIKTGDREMLEDLTRAAVNQALTRVRQLAAEETSKMAAGMGLPPGLNLPGMS